jgi:hypothetical protein
MLLYVFPCLLYNPDLSMIIVYVAIAIIIAVVISVVIGAVIIYRKN